MLYSAAKLLILNLIDSIRAYLSRSPLNGVLFVLLLVFTGASMFSFLGFVFSEVFLGIPLLSEPNMLKDFTDPEILPALRLMQVLQALGMLIVPSLIYLWISSSAFEMQRIFQSPVRQPVMISIVFFMVAYPFVNYLADWNASWELPGFIGEWMIGTETQAGGLTERFLDMPHVGLLIFNLIMIAILPAIGEELVFRGIVQRGLQKQFKNPHLAIWIAAALFSAIHFQFLGFVPRLLMGVAMGYLFFWSGNLWYPIIAHLMNNALAVVMAYGMQHGQVEKHLDTVGVGNDSLAAFSLVFCLMLLYLFKNHQQIEQS